jgi:hypothetical protein
MLIPSNRLLAIALAVFLAYPFPVWSGESRLLYGASVYIASQPGDPMAGFLAAAIEKRKLPIILAPTRQDSSYIVAAFAEAGPSQATLAGVPNPAVQAVWNGKIVLADAASHAIVWSADFHGPCRGCDSSPSNAGRILADRFIRRMQKDLFARKSLSARVDDFLAP